MKDLVRVLWGSFAHAYDRESGLYSHQEYLLDLRKNLTEAVEGALSMAPPPESLAAPWKSCETMPLPLPLWLRPVHCRRTARSWGAVEAAWLAALLEDVERELRSRGVDGDSVERFLIPSLSALLETPIQLAKDWFSRYVGSLEAAGTTQTTAQQLAKALVSGVLPPRADAQAGTPASKLPGKFLLSQWADDGWKEPLGNVLGSIVHGSLKIGNDRGPRETDDAAESIFMELGSGGLNQSLYLYFLRASVGLQISFLVLVDVACPKGPGPRARRHEPLRLAVRCKPGCTVPLPAMVNSLRCSCGSPYVCAGCSIPLTERRWPTCCELRLCPGCGGRLALSSHHPCLCGSPPSGPGCGGPLGASSHRLVRKRRFFAVVPSDA